MEKDKDFFVVGIGASAGGLEAVQNFFKHMPMNTGLAFIVIQHLSPDFKSLMPELLGKYTDMEIFTAEEGQEIRPNCIFLNQRNRNLKIEGKKLVLLEKAQKNHLNLPIDIFFHSLGEEFKDKSIGIILSGTGSDGSRGIKTIKEAGGTILVQEPGSAQFNGMPNSAILTNIADFVLDTKDIANKIVQFTSQNIQLETGEEKDNIEQKFQSILKELRNFSGVDFTKYKYATLLRRLEKRMSLHNTVSLADYVSYLKQHKEEKKALYQEFLIGVTSFFRDKIIFDLISNTVIPSIVEAKEKHETIRIWVAGCSSGEEVYSLAILFEEYIRNNKLNHDYKIFATDIDKHSLQVASFGRYPVNNYAEIGKKYLEEYFLKSGDQIQIIKKIREKIVFSYHDVTHDPPFIKMDLITCRNLLIYFENKTQNEVLTNFRYALNNNGYLVLGKSESLGKDQKHFKIIDQKWKIFQLTSRGKKKNTDLDMSSYHFSGRFNLPGKFPTIPAGNEDQKPYQEEFFYKYLSKKHSPASVFIDKEFNILFTQGNIKNWLSPTDGMFENNLMKMVDKDLATVIRNGLRRLNDQKRSVLFKNIAFDQKKQHVDLFLEKINWLDKIKDAFLIQFDEKTSEQASEEIVLSNNDISDFAQQRIEELEHELRDSKMKVQSMVEELETSNEELQSSNEELMSSNEELQSSNEELQSVNEELYTVNTEFQEKNKELENLHNDVNNLLNSTDIGTLFLDTSLKIRKFTPAIKKIFQLEDSDIGRSIVSFASEFEDETRKSIIDDSKTSLNELKTFEKEVKDQYGNWYLKRISPFITVDKKIEGVVITFVDINNLKKVKSDLGESESRLNTALEAGNMAWWETYLPSGKVVFSENKTRMLGRSAKGFSTYKHFMSIVHPEDYDSTMDAFRAHLTGKKDVYECQYRMKNNKGKYLWFHDVGKIISRKGEEVVLAGIVAEITSKKENEIALVEANNMANAANNYKNQFLANVSHELRTPMNGLLGFASLLRRDGLAPEVKNRYIDIIETNSRQLLNLVDDIIDISKIEAGELGLEMSDCDVFKMFDQVETTFNELKKAREKEHLQIVAKYPSAYRSLVIITDPDRLQQVLLNLVGNALKFSDKGTIEFGFHVEDDKIRFYVKDEGIGIPSDQLEMIFERFRRIEENDAVKYDGTGLGLSISKGIVDLLGGEMHVESEVNKGSEFSFTIPLKLPENPNERHESGINPDMKKLLNNRTILIAEDIEVNRIYFEELFSGCDATLLFANTGHKAVELFRNTPGIDLVLMDIRMPDMDGFEATRHILEENKGARVIAQTAYAMEKDKKKILSSGFAGYISKPVNKEELARVIAKSLAM